MKRRLGGWKKLLPRWIAGNHDSKTRHVEKASRRDVQSRVPTSGVGDWVTLSVLPSQNGENEAPSPLNLRMTEHSVADAPDAPKVTQGSETSARYEASPVNDESTRVEQSPRPYRSPHDIKDPEANPPPSPVDASSMNFNRLKRRGSPVPIQNFSPDGHMTILLGLRGDNETAEIPSQRPDHQELTSVGQGHLGPVYDEVHPSDFILENLESSESISDKENGVESLPNGLHHSEPDLDLQSYTASVREEQSHSQCIQYEQPNGTPVLAGPYHSRTLSERPQLESMTSDMDVSESMLERLGQTELITEKDNPMRDMDHRNPQENGSEGKYRSTPVEITKTTLQEAYRSRSESTGRDQENSISDKQSRPESFKSQESVIVKDQQRRLRREAKLHNLLSRNLQTRARAYQKRSQLRQSRSEISNADEAFMKLIRERRFQNNQDDVALQADFEKLQETRNRYGPLEDGYNALEEQLNREEYETKELAGKILESEIPVSEVDIDSRSSSPSETDSESPGFVRELYHPLYESYLSRLGDADLCREAVTELMIEHDDLLHAQEARHLVGLELSPDDQEMLRNFPASEVKLKDELTRIEVDVEYLRLQCVQEGLFGQNENESGDVGEGKGEDEVEMEEIDLLGPSIGSVDPIQPEYNKYPILLEKPAELEEENKSKVLLTDFKQGDVGDRITCWLLHKLRSSGLEVELLARLAGGLDRSTATERWQEEVLEFWFFDSTNLPASAYEIEPTLTAFPLSPLTDPKRISNRFSDSQLIQLVIRSSALSQKLEFGMWLKLTRMKGKSSMTCNT